MKAFENTGWNDKKAFLKKAELENKMQNLQCVKFEEAMKRFIEVQQICPYPRLE